ncbi:efflux RND transporter periplasmic adaptor subunit [Pseudidiomarina salinarum]|uniref:efflux RND transporter periplasmic adaptor subunit n=1 Tax=Pseudidiomarina salinarum TaxID=435908 RepID=UPI001E384E61|nr:efflux RND transporter periplasmic adaptor subunit [Pseudidiomarina salinarum]
MVAQRHVAAGEWLNPGDTVYQLVDLEQVYADFYLPEKASRIINNDLSVELHIAGSDQSFSGKLTEIVRVADIPSRTFLVRVQPEQALVEQAIIGAPLTGLFRIELAEQGLVVPRDALLRYPDGRIAIWVINRDQENSPYAEQHIVEIGRSFDGLIEIVSGLKEGDIVVVKGNEALQPEQPVEIIDADEASAEASN